MASIPLSISTGPGPGTAVALPMKAQNFTGMGMSILVNFSGVAGGGGTAATGTVTLQVSNDPNANPNGGLTAAQLATARWNNHDTLVSLTKDANSSIIYPVAYARLYANTAISGTVTAQIGIPDQL